MNLFSLLSRSLIIGMMRFGFGVSYCDNIYYGSEGQICYGVTENKTTDTCTDIPGVGFVEAFTRNPVTQQFYIIGIDEGETPYIRDSTEVPRFLMRFTADLVDGDLVIDSGSIEQIGATVPQGASVRKIDALAFTCQGVPRLFGLSSDIASPQYLYEIDYENNGTFTERVQWDITGEEDYAGYGLYYSINRDSLYRIAGGPTVGIEINPYNYSTNEVIAFLWREDLFWNDGGTQFASYYDETHFFTGGIEGGISFLASLENDTFAETGPVDSRTAAGSVYIGGIECADYSTICQNTFSDAPSTEPSKQPTYTPTEPSLMPSNEPSIAPSNYPTLPSLEPSMIPSNVPSVPPTEMPVGPEDPEPTLTKPRPSLADYASRNTYNFIILLIAPIIYLFY